MALSGFISKIVQSVTRTTFQFNKTLDVLIDRFKDACPSTEELRSLINQKNEINGALQQIEQKIATLNKVAQGAEIAVTALKAGVTIIKQLPIPTSVPPGIGIPVNIINNFSDALDNLGTLIDKEDASIDTIPEALDIISSDVGEVITKLNEFSVALDNCLQQDPNINQDDLDSLTADTTNFVGVLTNEQLEEILTTPPGLLYGDYYLRLEFLPSDFSFNKKQVIAQNKESVIDGEFYNPNVSVEEILGNESFSSSNTVLVDEVKWLIDTKDLIFPPPPPQEDPLKAIFKEGQIAILMAIYGASREEADELYELAWELSQNKGPTAFYYDTLVQEAFDNSRTILEQAVANEGFEWQQGDRILDSTIKTLFLADFDGTEQQIQGEISLIRTAANNLLKNANELGGNYNPTSKRWDNDGEFSTDDLTGRLFPFSERLALTAETQFSDATIGSEFVSLRPEMAKRKPLFQAIFEIANYKFLAGRPYNFNDPLKDYFKSKNQGYNQPIINEIPISGNANEAITSQELNDIYQSEIFLAENYLFQNVVGPDFTETPNGLTFEQIKAYSKTQIFLKLKSVLGINWYNANAQTASELPFWSPGGANPNSSAFNQNNVNNGLTPSDKWYFEFGRNGLTIPTG